MYETRGIKTEAEKVAWLEYYVEGLEKTLNNLRQQGYDDYKPETSK